MNFGGIFSRFFVLFIGSRLKECSAPLDPRWIFGDAQKFSVLFPLTPRHVAATVECKPHSRAACGWLVVVNQSHIKIDSITIDHGSQELQQYEALASRARRKSKQDTFSNQL